MNCPVLNTRKHKKGTTKISSINNLPHCTRTKTEVKKKKRETFAYVVLLEKERRLMELNSLSFVQ